MPPGTAKKKKKLPSTVLDKIVAALRALKDPGKGSSRTAIAKYLKSEYEYDNANALKKALKKGVAQNILIQTGQSFRVASDPIIESAEEKDPLVVEDLKVGKDDILAEPGDVVTVAYRGTLDNGYEFDKAKSFQFVLGAGDVIKGWDRGVANMKVGGKRKLTVPSKLGYGKRGCAQDIPPNATLHFVVTLKGLEKRED